MRGSGTGRHPGGELCDRLLELFTIPIRTTGVITCRKIRDRIRKKKMGEKRKAPPRNLGFGSMPVKGRCRPNMDISSSDEIARNLQDQGHHVPFLKEVLPVEKDIRIK